MLFNSLSYVIFLTFVLIVHFNLSPAGRIFFLTAASLVFYAFWSVPLTSLILIQTVVDFGAGALIYRSKSLTVRRFLLTLSLSANLGLLGYFKYANFFYQNIQAVFGDGATAHTLNILLPPGISFYTFHTMSYTIDVYRGVIRPTSSFARFFLYVTFFPQLVAGPIARSSQLLPQFDFMAHQRFSIDNFVSGLRLILWGMFKKIMLADTCAVVADRVFSNPDAYGPWSALVGVYAFTLQIYCDFSAYSEIAKGSARMFGVVLIQNFDQPYLSTGIAEFWRRWHISLSTWFRDYVYIPLGGSQKGKTRTLFNLVITMFLSGLWHGAAWTFVIWGLFHGTLLLIQALAMKTGFMQRLRGNFGMAWTPLSWFVTFHCVVIGWIFFRAANLPAALHMIAKIGGIFAFSNLPEPAQTGFIAFMGGFVLLSYLARKGEWLEKINFDPALSAGFYAAVFVVIAMWAHGGGPQFIYFQF